MADSTQVLTALATDAVASTTELAESARQVAAERDALTMDLAAAAAEIERLKNPPPPPPPDEEPPVSTTGTLVGTVTYGGQPLADTEVQVLLATVTADAVVAPWTDRTDAAGAFEIPAVPAGAVVVRVGALPADAVRPADVSATIVAGETTAVPVIAVAKKPPVTPPPPPPPGGSPNPPADAVPVEPAYQVFFPIDPLPELVRRRPAQPYPPGFESPANYAAGGLPPAMDLRWVPPAGTRKLLPAGGNVAALIPTIGEDGWIELEAGASYPGFELVKHSYKRLTIGVDPGKIGRVPRSPMASEADAAKFARIQSNNNAGITRALGALAGAAHYQLLNLRAETGPAYDASSPHAEVTSLVRLEEGREVANMPHHLLFDGFASVGEGADNLRMTLYCMVNDVAFLGFLFKGAAGGTEPKGVTLTQGCQRLAFVGGVMEGLALNCVIGGASAVLDRDNSDIVFRAVDFYTRPAWWANAAIKGKRKAHQDIKNGVRILHELCRFRNSWSAAQSHSLKAISTDENSPSDNPMSISAYNVFRYCEWDNVANAWKATGSSSFVGPDDQQKQHHLYLGHNRVTRIGKASDYIAADSTGNNGQLLLTGSSLDHLVIERNTAFPTYALVFQDNNGTLPNSVLRDNVLGTGTWGFKTGTGASLAGLARSGNVYSLSKLRTDSQSGFKANLKAGESWKATDAEADAAGRAAGKGVDGEELDRLLAGVPKATW